MIVQTSKNLNASEPWLKGTCVLNVYTCVWQYCTIIYITCRQTRRPWYFEVFCKKRVNSLLKASLVLSKSRISLPSRVDVWGPAQQSCDLGAKSVTEDINIAKCDEWHRCLSPSGCLPADRTRTTTLSTFQILNPGQQTSRDSCFDVSAGVSLSEFWTLVWIS